MKDIDHLVRMEYEMASHFRPILDRYRELRQEYDALVLKSFTTNSVATRWTAPDEDEVLDAMHALLQFPFSRWWE